MADLATIEQQIADTIAQQETAGGKTGVGSSLLNPGAIKFADWEVAYGAISDSSGFARFPSVEQGKAALVALVDRYILGGASIDSLIGKYAPVKDGNSNNAERIQQLAHATGLDPSQTIATQASAPKPAWDWGAILGSVATGVATGNPIEAGVQAGTDAGLDSVGLGKGTVWGRVAAFAIGIVFLIAGFFLLKETRVVIQAVGKKAAQLAPAAAAL